MFIDFIFAIFEKFPSVDSTFMHKSKRLLSVWVTLCVLLFSILQEN